MIQYSRFGLRIEEHFFSDDDGGSGNFCPDIRRAVGILSPKEPNAWRMSHTLAVDLAQSDDRIMSQFDKETRYEVRRASSKDGLKTTFAVELRPEEVDGFANYYDEFAKAKGLKNVFRKRLHELAKAGLLALSEVRSGAEEVLVRHASILGHDGAMLLYSASVRLAAAHKEHRALIGRANRLLHWYDMLSCKTKGCRYYDFGGLLISGGNREEDRIADFKKGFGGSVVSTFRRTTSLTVKGRASLFLLRSFSSSF